MPHPLAHPFYEAIFAFGNRNLYPGVSLCFSHELYCRGTSSAVIEIHAVAEFLQRRLVRDIPYLDEVFFGDVILRMDEFISEVPVVREEHHPFGVVVEPSHREYALLYVDEAHHCRPTHVIRERAYEVLRLIQENVDLRPLERYNLSVNVYAVRIRVCLCAEFGYDLTVDPNPPLNYQFLRLPSGRYPGLRYYLL